MGNTPQYEAYTRILKRYLAEPTPETEWAALRAELAIDTFLLAQEHPAVVCLEITVDRSAGDRLHFKATGATGDDCTTLQRAQAAVDRLEAPTCTLEAMETEPEWRPVLDTLGVFHTASLDLPVHAASSWLLVHGG